MSLRYWTADVSGLSRSRIKAKLWEELRQKAELMTKGVHISPAALAAARPGDRFSEQKLGGQRNRQRNYGADFPANVYLPYGLKIEFTWNRSSPYVIDLVDGRHCLTRGDKNLGEIQYAPRPGYYNLKSSDGVPLRLIGFADYYDKVIEICYSNECCYIERNEQCLFCNINYDKTLYAEKYGPHWRTPRQVAEAVKAAFDEGVADHMVLTGGVIAERRELDYYSDAGEEIKKLLGVDSFNGTAVVAAPMDFRNIDKFKEAGFRTTAMNLEIWDKDFHKAVCPGKTNHSGGWENWVKALEYAVGVFGWGRVRSNFVPGIEPKSKTVEGFEYLCGKGVVCSFNVWAPNVGSAFEGHRCPEAEWYVDLSGKLAGLWEKNGFTFDLIHDATAGDFRMPNDAFRIENEIFDIYKDAKDAA
jgi:hypothetical protein